MNREQVTRDSEFKPKPSGLLPPAAQLLQSQVGTQNLEYEPVCLCWGGVHFCIHPFLFPAVTLLHRRQTSTYCPHTRCGPMLEAAAISGSFLSGHLSMQSEMNMGRWRIE